MVETSLQALLLLSDIIGLAKMFRRAQYDPATDERFRRAWEKVSAKTEAARRAKK